MAWRCELGLSADEFWHMPKGLFYDLIACHEILNGAEELPAKAETPAYTGNHDYSIFNLK